MYKSLRAQTLHYFARPHEGIPGAPLEGPAAWRGDELRQRDDWIIHLTPEEVEELRAAARFAYAGGLGMGEMACADFPLPTLEARIHEWRDIVHHGRGFVLIRGVPVEEWTIEQCETFFWCLGLHLGIPGAQNPQNDLLGHVLDQQTGADVRFYRTNKAIAVHTDAADMVGLLCLKPAKSGGLSRIASSVTVFNELLRTKPQFVPRLFEPFYFDTKGEGGVRAFPIAPCRYGGGVLRTFWQSDYYRSSQNFAHVPRLTAAEQELLDAYDAIANAPEIYLDMELQPGDVQLLSNHTVLHARTAFDDWPEPERRRHLLRLWLSVPETPPLRERVLRARSMAGLVGTAVAQIVAERRRGFTDGGSEQSPGAAR